MTRDLELRVSRLIRCLEELIKPLGNLFGAKYKKIYTLCLIGIYGLVIFLQI